MGLAVVAFLALLAVPAAARAQPAAPPVPPMDVHALQNFLPIGPPASPPLSKVPDLSGDPGAYTKPWPGRRTLTRSATGFLRYQWACSVRDNYEHYEKIGRPGNPGDTTFK